MYNKKIHSFQTSSKYKKILRVCGTKSQEVGGGWKYSSIHSYVRQSNITSEQDS